MKTIKYLPAALFLCFCLCCGTSKTYIAKNETYIITDPEIQNRIYQFTNTVDISVILPPDSETWDGGMEYRRPYQIIFRKDSVYMWPNAFGVRSAYDLQDAVPQPYSQWNLKPLRKYWQTVKDSTTFWVGNSYTIDSRTGLFTLSVRDWWPMHRFGGNHQYYIESINENEMLVLVDFDDAQTQRKEKWLYKALPKEYRDTTKTSKFFKSKLDLVNYLLGCIGRDPIIIEK